MEFVDTNSASTFMSTSTSASSGNRRSSDLSFSSTSTSNSTPTVFSQPIIIASSSSSSNALVVKSNPTKIEKKKKKTSSSSSSSSSPSMSSHVSTSHLNNRNHITRSMLQSNPDDCPWRAIYESKLDQALIIATGFSNDTFARLLALFEPHFESAYREFVPLKSTPRRRKGRSLQPADALGLGLVYLNSTMHQKSLCTMFGMTEGSISRYIWSSLLALFRCLELYPDARVEWPSPHELEMFSGLVQTLDPHLSDVFGNLDSLSVQVQEPLLDQGIPVPITAENRRAPFSLHVFGTFCPDGTICWTAKSLVCARGSPYHEVIPRLAEHLLKDDLTPPNLRITAGRHFPASPIFGDRVFQPQAAVTPGLESPLEGSLLEEPGPSVSKKQRPSVSDAIRLFRDSAGLNMQDLIQSFPRLTVPLPGERTKREQVIEVITRLHNLRMRWIGLTNMMTTFYPLWVAQDGSSPKDRNELIDALTSFQ